MFGKSNMEEDSVLLQKRSDKPRTISKQNSREENWQIFKEYYLLKLIFTAIAAIVIWQVIQIAFFNKHPGLSITMIGVQTSLENEQILEMKAAEDLEINQDKEFVSVDENYGFEMLMPLLATGQLDIFLMDQVAFEKSVEAGYLLDLSGEGLPKGDVCLGQNQEDTEEKPYGVIVTDSEWLAQFEPFVNGDIILGIAINSSHLEMSKKFLHLIK